MSLSGRHSRKEASREGIITDPDGISNRALFQISQRELSRRLPTSTSTRATFSIYLRWLEVHRGQQTPRTEHWSNTVMHWVQSLASKGFSLKEVVEEVTRWKKENGPFESSRYRSPPTESEIRKAFEDDPKKHSERKLDRMGDSYRPGSTCQGDSRERGGEDGWGGERDPRREKWAEESRKESLRDRRHVDKTKFDGPPPPNYICNRCGKKGHHLQVCPTNLDPSYDRPPDDNYTCEICHKRGDHFKSLCPKNTDPFSIIQKRKTRGITTPPKGGSSRRDDWERESKAQRDRECDCHERRSRGRLTEYSSTSSARNTPPSGKKQELLERVQDIEDKKERLFREQSDDIGDMIRESTVQRSGERKRPNYEALSMDSPSSNTIQARKKVKMEENERLSPYSQPSEKYERMCTPRTQASYNVEDLGMEGNDTDMNGYADHNTEVRHSRKSTPTMSFALRPIGLSPGSMISDEESSDGMEVDEPMSRPLKEYSPFVQNLMLKRPQMNEVVNVVKRRKTAREMWKEADKLQRQQQKMRTPSEMEYGRLTPIAHDEVMTMQYDGACDDFDYDQTQDQKMTSAEEETLPNAPSNLTPTNSPFQTSNKPQSQEYTMASTNTNTNPETSSAPTPSSTGTVRFPQREEMDVASAFRGFAAQQRRNVEAVRMSRAQSLNDRPAKFQALKDFSTNFKLPSPVPKDLVPILTKDPEKQKEIQDKSERDVEELRRSSVNETPGSGSETGSATEDK